jgi:hypothetical protein
MLNSLTGVTQVKMEASDETFLEPLSSPLLSPLEIKTEKTSSIHLSNNNNNNILHQNHMHHESNNNNNTFLMNGTNYQNSHQVPHHNLNGYMGCVSGNISQSQHHQTANSNGGNYYNWSSQQQPTNAMYHTKYSPQNSNLCSTISRLMYVPPLTPPNSDPGSPNNTMQVSLPH